MDGQVHDPADLVLYLLTKGGRRGTTAGRDVSAKGAGLGGYDFPAGNHTTIPR